MTEEFDEEVQQFGDEESCFKCSDQPSVVLKQVQEWEEETGVQDMIERAISEGIEGAKQDMEEAKKEM